MRQCNFCGGHETGATPFSASNLLVECPHCNTLECAQCKLRHESYCEPLAKLRKTQRGTTVMVPHSVGIVVANEVRDPELSADAAPPFSDAVFEPTEPVHVGDIVGRTDGTVTFQAGDIVGRTDGTVTFQAGDIVGRTDGTVKAVADVATATPEPDQGVEPPSAMPEPDPIEYDGPRGQSQKINRPADKRRVDFSPAPETENADDAETVDGKI